MLDELLTAARYDGSGEVCPRGWEWACHCME